MSVVARLFEQKLGPGKPLRALAASGQLGYGIPEPALKAGLARAPHFVGCDMGSIDVGPYYLGSGNLGTAAAITHRDLRLVISGAHSIGVPLVLGTAGTAGAAAHLGKTLDVVRRIAREEGRTLRVATIRSDINRDWLKRMAGDGRTRPIGNIPALDSQTIDQATNIVGQAGTEAFIRALQLEPDIVIAGRACDTAVFAAIPLMLGYPAGPAVHMAKIIECTSICCDPGGRDAMLATLHGDHFDLESMNPARAATPTSVSAHSLYEQSDPLTVYEPEGMLHVGDARFEPLDGRRVRVGGATWHPASQHSIKIEGAAFCGHRAILLAGSIDPKVIEARDAIIEGVRRQVAEIVPVAQGETCELTFRVYGTGATALFDGARNGLPTPGEVFFLAECVASSEDLAKAVVTVAKQYLLHHGFPGRLSTGGNIAFPFTPPEVSTGPAYRYSIYHVAECDDLAGAFPVELETIRG
ncbi:acyclic terpene utilization AtuA family protein [Teichococcus oryzae]|uniref:DUF1446 domain-containing protein n=1 Tax=Teichococcus oryzae TaxID=1608942 RepID=A0A5B2TFP9_9PROT|nr:acyclic terpene utilization AtuA family protein [Pseudoroseomonas oryzae]KAA2212999.1 DUF1446 domain-containing protein [Pseudoroseomonas oryzae]